MELTNAVKLAILNNNLQTLLQEEYTLLTLLAIAVEVENKPQVDRLTPLAEVSRKTVDKLRQRIKVLEESMAKES